MSRAMTRSRKIGNREYHPPMEGFKRSNMDEVRRAFEREDAMGKFLSGTFTLVERSSYNPVRVTEESRRISAEALV